MVESSGVMTIFSDTFKRSSWRARGCAARHFSVAKVQCCIPRARRCSTLHALAQAATARRQGAMQRSALRIARVEGERLSV